MKKIIAISLLAACSAAMAENKPTQPAKPANAEAQAQAIAAAVAVAVQKQMQEQFQHQSALAYGGQASVSVAAPGRMPVGTATAPGLSSSGASDINGTCFGSSSGGVQAPGLGVSIGSTWQDNGCDARYDAAALRSAGKHAAANARLCMKAEIREAMEVAGTPCPVKRADQPSTSRTADYSGDDPIVRARLGLR